MIVVVKIGDRVYKVDIENTSTRPVMATVEGERFEVWPEESSQTLSSLAAYPQPIKSEEASETAQDHPATQSTSTFGGKTMMSPLPGVVTEVFVKTGEYIEAGHVVLVIEAMKMKNSIRTTRSGKISSVLVNPGETVSHKQPLIEFAE